MPKKGLNVLEINYEQTMYVAVENSDNFVFMRKV